MENVFIEKDCTIEHEGKTFTSGGSYIVPCSDGKMRGIVYVKRYNLAQNERKSITTWHGQHIAYLDTLSDYRGNFCKMTRITFTLDGRKFVGEYCPDWADACKVRSTK